MISICQIYWTFLSYFVTSTHLTYHTLETLLPWFSWHHPLLILLIPFFQFPSWSSTYLLNISPTHGFIFNPVFLEPLFSPVLQICKFSPVLDISTWMTCRYLRFSQTEYPCCSLLLQLVVSPSVHSPRFMNLELHCFGSYKSCGSLNSN